MSRQGRCAGAMFGKNTSSFQKHLIQISILTRITYIRSAAQHTETFSASPQRRPLCNAVYPKGHTAYNLYSGPGKCPGKPLCHLFSISAALSGADNSNRRDIFCRQASSVIQLSWMVTDPLQCFRIEAVPFTHTFFFHSSSLSCHTSPTPLCQ